MSSDQSDELVLILYTTAGCHLCEQAAAMLEYLQGMHDFRVEPVDIASDEALVDQYGIRIPVVRRQGQDREVGWPFEPEDVLSLF
ncbi:MAG: glutaredoxin family protein [Pseudomonadales bacterium]|nr:glutaredoxin family protein [Pseudomonadales bacterium]